VEFDAVFGLNDALALGAMRALQEAGLRIPEDVSVVGFDDIDEAQYTLPSLSTINPGREQIAALAVELLLARIRDGGGRPAEPREVLVDFEVVVRESAVLAE
jgi:DNA-binding LacI/PurR family transcriptional regulator